MNGMSAAGRNPGSEGANRHGMLVLGVNVGEYVQIGENIKVCVTKQKNDNLRLSIIAPKDVKILRGDVIEKDRRAAAAAAQAGTTAQNVTAPGAPQAPAGTATAAAGT